MLGCRRQAFVCAFVACSLLPLTLHAAPVLNTLSITPATVTLAPDESQLFSVSGIDQYGMPISVNPRWTASGGSIDTSGLFVAGAVAGDFQVTATDGVVSA